MKLTLTFLIGLLFGLGIMASGMGNPAKVLNFFDIAGTWDPSLALVMAGALAVTFVGYRLVLPRPDAPRSGPLFDQRFHLPTSRVIDLQLLGGAALFGVGWGIAGFCPGGALPALGTGAVEVVVFCAAMAVGLLIGKAVLAATRSNAAAKALSKT
jgi:uncharacterized membrane protein YedE/YeeE